MSHTGCAKWHSFMLSPSLCGLHTRQKTASYHPPHARTLSIVTAASFRVPLCAALHSQRAPLRGCRGAVTPGSAHTTYRVCDFNHFLRDFCCRNHIYGCLLCTIITIIQARRVGNTLKTGSVLQGCGALGVHMYVGCVNKPHQWGLSIVHPDL